MRKLLIWPGSLIMLVASLVIVDVTMIVVASSDRTVKVNRRSNDAPHRVPGENTSSGSWNMSVQLGVPKAAASPVWINLSDRHGMPLKQAQVSVNASPVGFEARSIRIDAEHRVDGRYLVELPIDEDGTWQLTVVADDDGDTQYMTVQRLLRTAGVHSGAID